MRGAKSGEQGKTTSVGTPHKINVSEKDLKASQFRFKCTSVKGAIIGEMKEYDLNGYFSD